jgi:hypothetical protein
VEAESDQNSVIERVELNAEAQRAQSFAEKKNPHPERRRVRHPALRVVRDGMGFRIVGLSDIVKTMMVIGDW